MNHIFYCVKFGQVLRLPRHGHVPRNFGASVPETALQQGRLRPRASQHGEADSDGPQDVSHIVFCIFVNV